jgi:hypothetical protein
VALRGCVRLLDLSDKSAPEKVKTYAELIARTQRADDRKAILSGLANVADVGALKLAEPFLNDAQVQAEAELAVLKIAGAITKSSPTEAKQPLQSSRPSPRIKPHATVPPKSSAG